MAGPVYASAILCLTPFACGFHALLSYCFPRFHLWLAPFEPGVLFMPGTIYGSEILCLAPFEPGVLFMPGTIVTVVIPSETGSKCAFGAR